MVGYWPDPFRAFSAQLYVASMAAESVSVVWMRAMGFSGVWSVPESEPVDMVLEKHVALVRAGQAALVAARRGGTPELMLIETLNPIRRAARDNRNRLSRRGLRKH